MALAGVQCRRQCHLHWRRGDAARWLASAAGSALNIGQGGGFAMLSLQWFRGAGRGHVAASVLCLAGPLLIAGCSDFKKTIGLEPTLPDEFAVESRAPLTIPPDFGLRPQEKSADQQAKQLIEQAGPGEPGKQASDFRLRRSEDGLPDIGARNGQAPDPNAAVADQSLSSKLLGYDGASNADGAVEKRETTPLKGVY